MLVLFCLPLGIIAALPALIHARLHGCAGSSCPEQNQKKFSLPFEKELLLHILLQSVSILQYFLFIHKM